MNTRILAIDTETFPIAPGLLIPRLVCVQTADETTTEVHHANPALGAGTEAVLWAALQDDATLIVGHNIAYDMGVIARAFPALLQAIWRKYALGLVSDTLLREQLDCIANGTLRAHSNKKGSFSLANLVKPLGLDLDKSLDSFRLRYHELWDVPVDAWPDSAVTYAGMDAKATRLVWLAQGAAMISPDERLQAAAAFALHLAAGWGVRADEAAVAGLGFTLERENQWAVGMLQAVGWMRPDGSVDLSKLAAAVNTAYAGYPPLTATGRVSTAEAVLAEAPNPPGEMLVYSRFKSNQKVLSTYLAPLVAATKRAMVSSPQTLVMTGRSAWRGARDEGLNLQNLPREGGVRECLIPRPGNLILSVDYDALELRSLGQVLLWLTDRSVLASRFQQDPDFDPHSLVGSQLKGCTYQEFVKNKKSKEYADFRQLAKAANFGLPGGMGTDRFIEFAKATYGLVLDSSQAQELKNAWFASYPEMRDYFGYIATIANGDRSIRQVGSGRIRGDVGFCDGANTQFQGLAADGAKRALVAVSGECYAVPSSALYGSRVVFFVHDENVLEVKADVAHEAAQRTVQVMESEMRVMLPDVPVRASPALAYRFTKNAQAVYRDGRLVVDETTH